MWWAARGKTLKDKPGGEDYECRKAVLEDKARPPTKKK